MTDAAAEATPRNIQGLSPSIFPGADSGADLGAAPGVSLTFGIPLIRILCMRTARPRVFAVHHYGHPRLW